MLRISFIVTAITLLLSACAPQSAPTRTGAFDPYLAQSADELETASRQPSKQESMQQTQKVAILLPLSGQHAGIGESLLNAAQLALFDLDNPSVELIPLDTKGTTSGTGEAISKAANQNVKLVLGPLLSSNVDRAGMTARQYNLNVIGFTTDSTRLGNNVFTVGILPYDQGRRLAEYAGNNNLNNVVTIVPNNQYAQEVTRAFEQTASQRGLNIVRKIPLEANDDPNQIAQSLAAQKGQFNAILLPFGNPQITQVAQALTNNGMGANTISWLGAGVWDDPQITSNSLMRGALYAAPSTQTRASFEQQYSSVYGQSPERLASLGYDATALAIVLLRQTNGNITRNAILNSNGFSGVDGVFRFKSNGMTERGLAIHRISGGRGSTIADTAPRSFKTAN